MVPGPGNNGATRYVGVYYKRNGIVLKEDTKSGKNIGVFKLKVNAKLVKYRLKNGDLVVGAVRYRRVHTFSVVFPVAERHFAPPGRNISLIATGMSP
jgi:hypothetical protein